MKRSYQNLLREQITRQLGGVLKSELKSIPSTGWIKSIRLALGMTSQQLARRLHVAQSTLAGWEKRESSGAITLKSLRKIADELECELVYALVPKQPLSKIIEQRAREVAARTVNQVAHSMYLEQQDNSEHFREKRIAEETQRLLRENPDKIWSENS